MDERRAAGRGEAALAQDEGERQRDRGGEAGEGPGGPALAAAFDQRQDDRDQGRAGERGAEEVEPLREPSARDSAIARGASARAAIPIGTLTR